MQTVRVASFSSGVVLFEVDYEDANERVVGFRCINNGNFNARGVMLDTDNNIIGQAIFEPGTHNIPILNGQKVLITEDGPELPYQFKLAYPA